jgi:hypothetical protein
LETRPRVGPESLATFDAALTEVGDDHVYRPENVFARARCLARHAADAATVETAFRAALDEANAIDALSWRVDSSSVTSLCFAKILCPVMRRRRSSSGRQQVLRVRFMKAITFVFFLIVGSGSALLAYGFWEGWQAAARNSASPGAIVLPLIAITFGLFSIGCFVRAASTWRRRKKEPDAP